jgi:hypothetical protein
MLGLAKDGRTEHNHRECGAAVPRRGGFYFER